MDSMVSQYANSSRLLRSHESQMPRCAVCRYDECEMKCCQLQLPGNFNSYFMISSCRGQAGGERTRERTRYPGRYTVRIHTTTTPPRHRPIIVYPFRFALLPSSVLFRPAMHGPLGGPVRYPCTTHRGPGRGGSRPSRPARRTAHQPTLPGPPPTHTHDPHSATC